jgi:hypothetical protein
MANPASPEGAAMSGNVARPVTDVDDRLVVAPPVAYIEGAEAVLAELTTTTELPPPKSPQFPWYLSGQCSGGG